MSHYGRYITHGGITDHMAGWSLRLGGSRCLVSERLKRGWSEEAAVTTPITSPLILTHNGLSLTVSEWVKRTGLDMSTIYDRLHDGATVVQALTVKRRPQFTRSSVVEDAELLAGAGETLERAAERIGYKKTNSLIRVLERAGRGDLACKLRRNGRRI